MMIQKYNDKIELDTKNS